MVFIIVVRSDLDIYVGVLASGQHYCNVKTGEKLISSGFKALDKDHKSNKSYFYLATPINHA